MDTNDLNRRIRYAFMLDDNRVLELFMLAGYPADLDSVASWRQKPGDDGFADCPADAVNALLNGLIIQKRGPRPDSKQQKQSVPVQNRRSVSGLESGQDSALNDNNTVLKQLRIAMALRTEEVHKMITDGGGKLGNAEVNALFRKPDSRNYRRCGDQVLRWFLAGVAGNRDSSENR